MFDVVKTAGLAHRSPSKIGSGEHVTSSPFPSNSTSNCAAPRATSCTAVQPSPQRPLQKPAGRAVPASSSAWSPFRYLGASCCQHMLKLCSACQKTGLIYLAFQQIRERKKKKSFKKGKIEFGNSIPWRVSNGSFSLPLLQASAFITSPCQCYYEETNSIMRSFPI